jgi:uncharacterized SAM-binding protein YcdF (DUF218 family)
MANAATSNRSSSRKGIAAIILLVAILLAILAARGAGRWLTRQDPLAHADVIVALSGGLPYRAEAAAALYKQGYAPEVWISKPDGPQEDLAALGIQFIGEEEYNREIAVKLGVPPSAIQILPDPVINTEQEILEIPREMRRTGKRSVIIVTSPEHTRRVRALWRKLAGDDFTLIVRVAPDDPFDADHWWTNTRDTFSVVREFLGLTNVWLGLPVRPHSEN